MRRDRARARRVIGLSGAAALVLGGSVAIAAAPVAAATTTAHSRAELAAAWANAATTDVTVAADISSCGTMSRSSATAIVIHGIGHALRGSCPGTLLRQAGTGSVQVDDMTLRDAMIKSDDTQGSAIDAAKASVRLDHDTVTENNSYSGAVHAKTVAVFGSTLSDNGVVIESAGIGSAGAILASGAVTVQNSTIAGNEAYGDGAGIRTTGDVTVTGSRFSANGGKGGGVAISAADATITNSTFDDNDAYAAEAGGAVGVSGTMHVTHSTFTDNRGGLGNGGAIGGHEVDVLDSTFSGNTTDDGSGGAISGDIVSVTRSTFHANSAVGDGGAIHVGQSLVAVASTFDANSTAPAGGSDLTGGAISGASGASIGVVNSTLTANSTAEGFEGSAIYVDGPLRLQFDTIAANPTRPDPSDTPVSQVYGTGAATLNPVRGTVITGGAPGRDCTITTTSGGANYDDDGTCGFTGTGDVSHGANPQLGALKSNGGPTLTRMPAATSPLVDKVVGTCIARDQRGVTRPRGSACDIGAVER